MGLPHFRRPPVIEVALSVQFEPLTALHTPHLGLLWERVRENLPRTEEHFPLDPVVEQFEPRVVRKVGVQVAGIDTPPVPRVWFLNPDGTELIQVQQDRFVHNWRKMAELDEYPRYKFIRNVFESQLDRFQQFVGDEKLGVFAPNHCEVTYVNHILAGEGWLRHGELDAVVTAWASRYSDEFLTEPEEVSFSAHYIIGGVGARPIGRLHIDLQPAYRISDKKAMFVLTLTARVRPNEPTLAATMQSLDIGHEWIVRGFTSITTKTMHRIWERLE